MKSASTNKNFYSGKKVCITGGAGFIGSHLLEALIIRGAVTTVIDNLSTGSLTNLKRVWKNQQLKAAKTTSGWRAGKHKFIKSDLQEFQSTVSALKGQEVIFHLAANIGGRGYITAHPADCCEGFAINQNLIKAAHLNGAERVLFASSACVYPIDLQKDYNSEYLLNESDAWKKGWANSDEPYGWAKLMGEEILLSYNMQYGLKGAVTRYVTAYGPYENASHAVIALIGRALRHEDPFVIWGSGKQDRDFTFVEDIVSGTLLACEKITDASAVNLGTARRYTLDETAKLIFEIVGWKPKKIVHDKSKPEGVKTRALDNRLAKKLGWTPKYDLRQGLEATIDWYRSQL